MKSTFRIHAYSFLSYDAVCMSKRLVIFLYHAHFLCRFDGNSFLVNLEKRSIAAKCFESEAISRVCDKQVRECNICINPCQSQKAPNCCLRYGGKPICSLIPFCLFDNMHDGFPFKIHYINVYGVIEILVIAQGEFESFARGDSTWHKSFVWQISLRSCYVVDETFWGLARRSSLCNFFCSWVSEASMQSPKFHCCENALKSSRPSEERVPKNTMNFYLCSRQFVSQHVHCVVVSKSQPVHFRQ